MFYILTPYIIGVIMFFATAFSAGTLINEPRCSDGWNSPSIGRQGSCSYHDGIKEDPLRYLVFPAGLTVGLFSYAYASGVSFISKGVERHRRKGKVFCPKCGSEMRIRNGKRGKFYGCSKYPYCTGSMDVDEGEKRKE